MVMPALKQEKYDFSHNHKGQKNVIPTDYCPKGKSLSKL